MYNKTRVPKHYDVQLINATTVYCCLKVNRLRETKSEIQTKTKGNTPIKREKQKYIRNTEMHQEQHQHLLLFVLSVFCMKLDYAFIVFVIDCNSLI